jgi:hypothetical protein
MNSFSKICYAIFLICSSIASAQLPPVKCLDWAGLCNVLSFITEPGPIKDILTALKMPTAPPETARSSFRSEQADFKYEYDYAE